MSRTLIPLAYSEMITAFSPSDRVACLGTSAGLKLPSRSRGTASRTGPTSVFSVLALDPFRRFSAPAVPAVLQVRVELGRQARLQHLPDHPRQQPARPGQRHRLPGPGPLRQLPRQRRHHLLRQHQPAARVTPVRARRRKSPRRVLDFRRAAF